MASEHLVSFQAVYFMAKNSPYQPAFAKVILAFTEGGIIDKLRFDFLGEAVLSFIWRPMCSVRLFQVINLAKRLSFQEKTRMWPFPWLPSKEPSTR
jgi:hypothetical protein